VRSAPSISDRGASSYADRLETRDHVEEHGVLATMKMTGAGRIDDESVWSVGSNDRRITQCPDGKAFQGLVIRCGIRVMDDNQDLAFLEANFGRPAATIIRSRGASTRGQSGPTASENQSAPKTRSP
jgi:hypothetical protein